MGPFVMIPLHLRGPRRRLVRQKRRVCRRLLLLLPVLRLRVDLDGLRGI